MASIDINLIFCPIDWKLCNYLHMQHTWIDVYLCSATLNIEMLSDIHRSVVQFSDTMVGKQIQFAQQRIHGIMHELKKLSLYLTIS